MKNITRIGKIYLKISIVELDSRLRGNDTRGAGMTERRRGNATPPRHPQPKAKRFGLGIHSDWIPACAGMTERRCGIHPPVILNRKQSASDWGSIPSRHPQPKAKRFGLGIQSLPSSSTESEALRIGDLVLTGFPFSRE